MTNAGDSFVTQSDVEALTWEIVDDRMHGDSDREYSSAEEEPLAVESGVHLEKYIKGGQKWNVVDIGGGGMYMYIVERGVL